MTTSLGDFFPEHEKNRFSEDSITPGCVISCLSPHTKKPKPKFFIIVALSADNEDIGIVYINSEINPNVFRTEELRSLHVGISKKNHGFLAHDSYVDCSYIYERSCDEIKGIIASDTTSVKGMIEDELFERIVSHVISAKTINRATLEKYQLQ